MASSFRLYSNSGVVIASHSPPKLLVRKASINDAFRKIFSVRCCDLHGLARATRPQAVRD